MAQVEGMKTCTKCVNTLLLSAFYLTHKKDRKPSYRSVCKKCLTAASNERQKANPEKNRQKAKKWRDSNPEKYKKTWMAYRERNVETMRKRCLDWRYKNRELAKKLNAQWAKNNPSKTAAQAAKRRSALLKATPSWVNFDAIQIEYDLAKWCSDVMGEKYHVDHIVPLQGKFVCGLHVHNNLQVIPASVNLTKSNSFKEL